MTTKTNEKPKHDDEIETDPGDLPGIPGRSQLGKQCLEWLTRKGQINDLQKKQVENSDGIMAAMKKAGREAMKFQDPDTKEWHYFTVNPGHDKLSVRKAKETFEN